jgi:preprotein translocase subunit SecA
MINFISKSLQKVFGTKYDKDVKQYEPYIDEINQLYESYQSLSNDELRNKTLEFRKRIKEYLSEIDQQLNDLTEEAITSEDIHRKEDIFKEIDILRKQRDEELEVVLKEILPESFAVVKETARRFKENSQLEMTATEHDRELAASGKSYIQIKGDKALWKNSWPAAGNEITWDMLHYDVQLIGGMVLHDGKIAEMATGEGKTLVATLPAYLNGLGGEGVHIITVNDYLARRDSEWVGPIFEFLLLRVDCIDKYRPHSPERIRAYRCDITYGTNNEFGFDYLRDNMVVTLEERVQRKHHFAMVDEVDSVLIDDARTPLIISGPATQGADIQEYIELKPRVERLIEAQRKLATEYLAEAKKTFKEGKLGNEEGEAGMYLLRAHRALPKYRPLIKFLSEEGVKVALQKSENFYMQEQSKNMHIVDEPLLFTINEKTRSVELTEAGAEFLARGGEDPNFFIMPDLAFEMNEIDINDELSNQEKKEAKEKLAQDYAVKSQRLHSINQLLKAYTLFEKDEEYVVIDGQVKIVDEQTGRMMEGRRYSDGLHQALEAKENVKIGEITQTYATVTLQNYFRMYHKLAGMTGTAETEASEFWEIYKLDVVVIPTNKPIQRDDREDLVFKTSREKFNAVIDEIVELSNAGRPVLVGTTSVDISEKLSRMLKLRGISHNVLNAKQHQREAEIVAEAGKPGKVTIATNMAGRGTDIKISEEVKKAGGLAIIGTERHDSRRVDRQLRGRAGRQGDPGSSQFYVSLEDNLMRLFQSERIAKLMDRMGHQEGDVIQHSMVSKSIERAQKKVEENNFGIRKRLLEYDDVMNIQREAIYKKRNNALSGERLSVDLNYMFSSLLENIAYEYKESEDLDGLHSACVRILGFDPEIDPQSFRRMNVTALTEHLLVEVNNFYKRKSDHYSASLLPLIKNVFENEGHRYKRIALPFSDGSASVLNVSASLEEAVKSNGHSIINDIEKTVALALLDENWKEHLRAMDELKESVQAASFEQKDPLVIYKMEAYGLFEQLIHKVNLDVCSYLSRGRLLIQQEGNIREAQVQRTNFSKTRTSRDANEERARMAAASAGREAPKVETIVRSEKKVGRNDMCPCGSGKKYKHCHGQ